MLLHCNALTALKKGTLKLSMDAGCKHMLFNVMPCI